MTPIVVRSLLLLSAISLAAAVFQDEAFQTDYHYALLGIPRKQTTFFHRPQSSFSASLLYTLSEKHVVGAVNPKNGSVIWRQRLNALSPDSPGFLRAAEDQDTVISAIDGQVAAWDLLNGKAVWWNRFSDGTVKDLEILPFEDRASGKDIKDAIALLGQQGKGIVRRLGGMTGDVVWEYHDDSGDIPYQLSTTATSVYLVSLHGRTSYKIRVTTLDPLTGKQQDRYTLSSDSDISDVQSIHYVGANVASPIIAWTDRGTKVLKINVIGSKQVHTFKTSNDQGDEILHVSVHAPHLINSLPHFLVHYQTAKSNWAEVYHINLAKSTVSKAYDLPRVAGRGTFSTSNQDANVYFVRNTEAETVLVSSVSHGILERWPVSSSSKQGVEPLHAVSEVVVKPGPSYAVRSAVTLETGDWVLLRNGEVSWERPEALSGVVATEWAEFGAGEALTDELDIESHQSVLGAYVHRWRRHVRDLRRLPAWLQQHVVRSRDSLLGRKTTRATETGLKADSYGFRKLVVVATENGRLYALDTGKHGKVVWATTVVQLGDGKKWAVKSILPDSFKSQLRIKDAMGRTFTVDVMTGKILNSTSSTESSSPIESTAVVNSPSGSIVLDIHEDGHLGDIPTTDPSLLDKTVVIRSSFSNSVKGLRFLNSNKDSSSVRPVTAWEFRVGPSERIAAITSRPAHDPVASIGRVLGDRSVLYKYLNPNLVLVTVINESTSVATFHLLDGISGRILSSMTQSGVDASQAITVAMSENWFVWSFYSEVASNKTSHTAGYRGYQMGIVELYMSSIPNDRGISSSSSSSSTNFSTLHPPADNIITKPHLMTTKFFIPEPISALSITQTKQGITSRSILAILPSSHSLMAIPRNLLDPRRPSTRDPTTSELEEGLLRRGAALDFDPRWTLNHIRPVMGLKFMKVSPASVLESTCLVFAHGDLDIFGTRISPSLPFDLLGKEFGKIQLLVTLLALGIGVLALRPSVRRKGVDGRWIG